MFKWPKVLKSVGFYNLKIHIVDRKAFDKEAGELEGFPGFIDFEKNKIYVCTEETEEFDRCRRKDFEIFSDIVHELIHFVADNQNAADLDEEAAVDLHAREITRLLIECGVFEK